MKEFIFLEVILLMGMISGYAQSKYLVAGVVERGEKVYLIAEDGGRRDTLNETFVVNGRFEMSGKLDRVVPVKVNVVLNGKIEEIVNISSFNGGGYFVYSSYDKSSGEVLHDRAMAELAGRFCKNERQFMERREALFQRYLTGTEEVKDSVGQAFREVIHGYERTETELVMENPDSYATAAAILGSVVTYTRRMRKFDYALGDRVASAGLEVKGWKEIELRYVSLYDRAKEWAQARNIEERMASVAGPIEALAREIATSVGQVAPDFTVDDPEGKPFTLYSVKGKLKLIDFWGSFCSPCRAENPHLLALYKKYNNKGFEVISISLDRRKKDWLKAVSEDGLTWKYNGCDRVGEGSAALLYGVTAVPVTILLDENNKIIGRHLNREQLERKLEEYLK